MELTDKLILIAEDDDSTRKNIETELKGIGFKEFVLCRNGSEALNYMKSENTVPFLIVSDCEMPVMGGLEWLNEAKNYLEKSSRKYPEIIIVSNDIRLPEAIAKQLAEVYGREIYHSDKIDFVCSMRRFLKSKSLI